MDASAANQDSVPLGSPSVPPVSRDNRAEFAVSCGDFKTRLASALDSIWETEDFVDVTLACEGRRLKAHRLVLSMGSAYFKSILRDCDARSQHPVIFFRDISFADLKSVVDFLYTGCVTVRDCNVSSFFKTAQSLRVDGLTFVQRERKPQDDDEPLSLCVDSRGGVNSVSKREYAEDEEEPLCMTYEPPPEKKSKPCTSNGEMFGAGGLVDFQQLDGMFNKMASFCADGFDSGPQAFSRFHHGKEEMSGLSEEQAWDLNYRSSAETNSDSVTDLSNGGAQQVVQHECITADEEQQIEVEPLPLHHSNTPVTTTSASNAILPVISLDLTDDGAGIVASSPTSEMNLTMKREDASNGHSDAAGSASSDQELSQDQTSNCSGKGKEVTCGQCGKAYVNIRSLQMHRKVHTGETTCPICHKIMNRTSDIKRHIQMVHYANKCGGSGAVSPLDNRLKY
ncbi:unnamed protein product [Notodromas monacha]|uniref:Broad-complex n=1 Tax=Notodromas monacha TaxID=399045 RepID=A0A7R9BW23_9CRUS|nr:unnamed protein product [Notodromas monacha]CAG0921701.1 unnamed protein product [Notodromas monacha]